MYKLFSIILVISLCLSISHYKAHAFVEEFNSTYSNPTLWEQNNLSGISFGSTSIILEIGSSNVFPYIRNTTTVINPSDDQIEIKFNFLTPGVSFGNGFAMTDSSPDLNTVMTYPDTFRQYSIFYVWHSPGVPYFHIVTFLCSVGNPGCSNAPIVIYQSVSPDLSDHVFKVVKQNNHYLAYLDNVLLFESENINRTIDRFWIGHPETTQTFGTWASFQIDYIKSINTSPSPVPSPSVVPSPIPSPIASPVSSNVPSPLPSAVPSPLPSPLPTFPYYSQLDPLWSNIRYDRADKWASVGEQGIGRWGCALTSAVMILNQYDIRSLSGQIVTPDTLNTWLTSQPDGYLGNGLVNWLAVTRYARLSYNAGYAPTKLEYRRMPYTLTSLQDLLADSYYPILGTSGHFVVAYHTTDDSILVNDPSIGASQLVPNSTPYSTMNTFIPSTTDLSYFLFSYDPSLEVVVTGPDGLPVDLVSELEYLQDESSSATNTPMILAYLEKPDSGKYKLSITNQDDLEKEFTLYIYDKEGKASYRKLEIDGETSQIFSFYNKPEIRKSKIDMVRDKWQRWYRRLRIKLSRATHSHYFERR